jgi:anthranilate synthase/aminodeoxychorismate synthase-like glutamine amidotransferase
MILVIDNYDSFVHNLARYVRNLGYATTIMRNDAIALDDIETLAPEAIILSPGPGAPREAGLCKDIITRFGHAVPILGVCLGHQAIGEVYGGTVLRASEPVHGRDSLVFHDGTGLFHSIPSPFRAGRYHSLAVNLPSGNPLRVTARAEDGEIMAMEHMTYPVVGIQFHPESILTEHGPQILKNFFAMQNDCLNRKVV